VPAEPRDGQDPGHLGPQRRQPQPATEQDRAPLRAHQDREAAGVGIPNRRHVDDEPAGTWTEQAQQPLAHSGGRHDVKIVPEGHDDVTVRDGKPGKGHRTDVLGHRMSHTAFPIRWIASPQPGESRPGPGQSVMRYIVPVMPVRADVVPPLAIIQYCEPIPAREN
jgi:hypothetical protein